MSSARSTRPSDETLARLRRVGPAHYVASDPCEECEGTGHASFAEGEGERVDECRSCSGRGYVDVEYVVEASCEALGDACEGATCVCLGDGWRTLTLAPHELLEQPESVGSAAQRAEAAELVAAIEWAEARESARAADEQEPAIAAE